MAYCSFSSSSPTIVHFIATVQIPVGYVVDRNNYSLHFTMDKSNLKYDRFTELRPSVITLDDSIVPPLTINCLSAVYQFALHGTIFYNLIIERFSTSENLTSGIQTAFSDNNCVPINTALGYSCVQCEQPPSSSEFYTIELQQSTEFVISDIGAIVPYNAEDPSDFFEVLSDPNTAQVIQVPYTLVITPTT